MNKTRKLASLLLALVMVLGMVGSAMAATINITGGATGSEYAAWMLLNVTDGGNGKFAYTVNTTYADALKEVTLKTTDAEIVDYISKLDADGIRNFADAIYAKVKDLTPDATTASNKFENVAQGYWLIAETKLGSTNVPGATDTYTLVMLDTAGKESVDVATKESWPTVDKQVEEKNDTTGATSWGDVADYDIGDTISYKLIGTLPTNYANYETYKYQFTDTLSEGLTYNGDAKVYAVNGDAKVEITETFTPGTIENGFTLTCANLKAVTSVSATTSIVVEYTATLNEKATIGSAGNENTVTLTFSNNPNAGGEGSTGTTPPDEVIVFTFELDVNKVDSSKNPLTGAGFTLYKKNSNGQYVQIGEEVKGEGMTTFIFKGLDEGDYKLEETTVPAGYNKIADIEFKIVSALNDVDNAEALTSLEIQDKDGKVFEGFTINVEADKITNITTDVVNQAGSELPSTGGMGTTLFYIAGSLLVVGALVLMITKRRVAEK